MEIFEERFTVAPAGLTTGDLFRLMQKISGDHCRLIGYGEPVMEAKGIMWVIIRHSVSVNRWPGAGEELLAQTWPGPTRHGMCPRWYRVLDSAGTPVLSGCAVWSVVDRVSRKMVIPSAVGVEIEPLVTGLEGRRPAAPARLPATEHADYTVPHEVLDENGHMNNTRYYDLAEGLLGTLGRPLRSAAVEYIAEAREGDTLHLSWAREGSLCAISGETDGPAFRMALEYEASENGD